MARTQNIPNRPYSKRRSGHNGGDKVYWQVENDSGIFEDLDVSFNDNNQATEITAGSGSWVELPVSPTSLTFTVNTQVNDDEDIVDGVATWDMGWDVVNNDIVNTALMDAGHPVNLVVVNNEGEAGIILDATKVTKDGAGPVSYTHLTLPTIYSV